MYVYLDAVVLAALRDGQILKIDSTRMVLIMIDPKNGQSAYHYDEP